MNISIGPYPKGSDERVIDIKVDGYDVWNLDHTLALIISPCLKKLKEIKHGSGYIDPEDVPEELKPSEEDIERYNKNGSTDENFFKRYDYVLDEMIFAFDSIIESYDMQIDRIDNGLRLFGKYYRTLWD